jgi:hypothetical protein
MTTASEAYGALRSVIEGGAGLPPLRWQNEDEDSTGAVALPDTPAPFLYSDFYVDSGEQVGFGGGRFANVYRNPAWLDVYVFVPKGWGLTWATDTAESVAQLLRSYRDDLVSVIAASVRPGGDGASLRPPGLPSEVSNYFWAATEVRLFFDTIG